MIHRDDDFWKQVQQDLDDGMLVKDCRKKWNLSYFAFRQAVLDELLISKKSLVEISASYKIQIMSVPTEEFLEIYQKTGGSLYDICLRLKVAYTPKVRRLLREKCSALGLEKPKAVPDQYSLEDLVAAIETSISLSEVCRKVNVTVCSYNFDRIRKLCALNHIDINKFNKGDEAYVPSNNLEKFVHTEETCFIKDSKVPRSSLRVIARRLGFFTGSCSECGCGEMYNNKPLTLELDHINGDCHDNRKENLRWVCPNCHSQTPTFKRRKKLRK